LKLSLKFSGSATYTAPSRRRLTEARWVCPSESSLFRIQGKTGYICTDLEELKEVIARLMRSNQVFDSDDCRRRAQEFDWMSVVKRYVELYRGVLNGDAW